MDRRGFIGSLAIGLLTVPIVARAQQPAIPVIGFLGSASPAQWSSFVAAFRKGLNEVGYIEGQNVTIEFRWAEGQYDRLPAMAAELAQRRVSVIVAAGGTAAALAARKASATIPIVFSGGDDPVGWLLGQLAGVEDRRARYVSELVILSPSGEELRGTGALEGRIAAESRGTEGFGFDPIFVPNGEERTVAELGNDWKRENSHRANAARALLVVYLGEAG